MNWSFVDVGTESESTYTELPKHMDDNNNDFLAELLP